MSSSVTNASGRISRAEAIHSPVAAAEASEMPESEELAWERLALELVELAGCLSVAELERLVELRRQVAEGILPLWNSRRPAARNSLSLVVYFFLHLWPMSNAPKNLQISFYQGQ